MGTGYESVAPPALRHRNVITVNVLWLNVQTFHPSGYHRTYLVFTGSDASGQPIQGLILTRYLAWEAGGERVERSTGPGVVLIP